MTTDEMPDEPVVVVPIEDSIDLHTFRPREVRALLDDYLEAARDKGFKEVRVIHGKGTGALRERVHAILRTHPLVDGFRQADDTRGSWGATVVSLKQGQASPADSDQR